jgi:hypothetical protein
MARACRGIHNRIDCRIFSGPDWRISFAAGNIRSRRYKARSNSFCALLPPFFNRKTALAAGRHLMNARTTRLIIPDIAGIGYGAPAGPAGIPRARAFYRAYAFTGALFQVPPR